MILTSVIGVSRVWLSVRESWYSVTFNDVRATKNGDRDRLTVALSKEVAISSHKAASLNNPPRSSNFSFKSVAFFRTNMSVTLLTCPI